MKAKDMTGQTFGKLTVLEYAGVRNTNAHWLCRCECGRQTIVIGLHLRQGRSRSCGNASCKAPKQRIGKGSNCNLSRSTEYVIWNGIIHRCTNPNYGSYRNYGARGIKVCERWLDFQNFLADMGERPAGMSIDRIDNDGDYCPENCRWATQKEQARNTRSIRLLEFRGRKQPVSAWCEELGLPSSTLKNRLDTLGWSVERSLATPCRHYKREKRA